jgi:beta-lactamase superfamily II metal-dependent hydrolase
MYKFGTGDCFILKFFNDQGPAYTMMIDGGFWKYRVADRDKIQEKLNDLKAYVNGVIDLLVITHEHLDHVQLFEKFPEFFTDEVDIKNIWMGWTEDDSQPRVKRWKREYGAKKMALGRAVTRLEKILNKASYKKQFSNDRYGGKMLAAKKTFGHALKGFADLHLSLEAKEYVGLLKGMRVIKEEVADNNIRYLEPGEIIENIPGLDGIRFYVLGPPEDYRYVKRMEGHGDETYTHNDQIQDADLLAAALTHEGGEVEEICPFDVRFIDKARTNTVKKVYKNKDYQWRSIDQDWLFSAGALALRMNSMTNNLSVVLAIEYTDSKKVMLFPGDAEYGSWRSWHRIKWSDGSQPSLAKDLLGRTVFYKVAHHLSHNGTAKKEGLELMTHYGLTCMATLDYSNISDGWKSTMPNRAIVKEVLDKTKGRLIIMNENNIHYDLNDQILMSDKIQEARHKMNQVEKDSWQANYKEDPSGKVWAQFKVEG